MVSAQLILVGALSAIFATFTSAQTCSIMKNVDILDNDITFTNQVDPTKCCDDCKKTLNCKAYNWFDGVCYLKSGNGTLVSLPGAVSGFVQSATVAPTKPPVTAPVTTKAPITSAPTPATSAPTKPPVTSPPTTAPVTSAPTKAPTPSCSRVRRSWDVLSAAEKETFISALELAMDKGYYQKFVLIHQEQMSNREAHGSCVFLFWHRKYLLAFENMLRSLGEQYKCLTLPYWDYVQHYSTMQKAPANQKCKTIETCSPVTVDLGGSSKGITSRKSLFGQSFSNFKCITNRPLNHMCTDAGASSSTCDRCVPRGSWSTTAMDSDMSISSVRSSILKSGSSLSSMSSAVEMSPHGRIHMTLNGAMANVFVSPADPIFFLHHNTIDLYHAIFYHCRVEPLNLTDEQKKTNNKSFEGCQTNNRERVGPMSSLRMRVAGNRVVEASADPLVGQFFKNLPDQYYKLTDVRALGYSYEFKGLLGDMYDKCDGSTMESATIESAEFEVQHVVKPIVLEENKVALSMEEEVIALAEAKGLSREDGYHEVRKMTLVMHESCLPGSVTDFSDEFKKQWNINTPSPSFALLQNIRSGADPIVIPGWQSILAKYYNCSASI